MPYDYTEAPPPRDVELIPHGTIATVAVRIRAGNAGEDGLLKRSAKGDCEMLDLEFVVVDGEFKRRKFWEYLILDGTTDGHAKAAGFSRGTLRTIIESARGIKPDDVSPQARAARTVGLKDFDGLTFIAKIGVEKGKPKNDGSGENYPDKNILAAVITPDKREWHPIEQAPPWNSGGDRSSSGAASASGSPGPGPAITRPAWAS
jgi:hypothetical protein